MENEHVSTSPDFPSVTSTKQHKTSAASILRSICDDSTLVFDFKLDLKFLRQRMMTAREVYLERPPPESTSVMKNRVTGCI